MIIYAETTGSFLSSGGDIMLQCAGVVLCGGRSGRMGRAKALLPFGPETMLARVVRLLGEVPGEVVGPVIVVAAANQELPDLPGRVEVARDRRADRGPLEGLAVGLRAAGDRVDAAFVTACDVPLLLPEFVGRMIELSAGHEIAVPHVEGHDHPLSAVYRTAVLPAVEALLSAGRLRPAFLFDQFRTRRVTAAELADVDQRLQSLANVNDPTDYQAALAAAKIDS